MRGRERTGLAGGARGEGFDYLFTGSVLAERSHFIEQVRAVCNNRNGYRVRVEICVGTFIKL